MNALPHHWNDVKALFQACLDSTAEERARLLAAAPDPVRVEVEALLATDGFASPLEGNAAVFASPLFAKETAQEEPVPENIGPYRVTRRLGHGGMGVVYLAEQTQPHRQIAIKLVAVQRDPALLARFRREADALARLSHPGIARVFDVGSDAGRPYLVMEYIDGEPLSQYAGSLTREGRLELLARIADAVEHAHTRGVVHRDLKPSNILVDAEGQPKVLDFGIALLSEVGAESLTATGTLLGTPAYMSPEQALGDRAIDARADVYALGVLGYELLTDRLPLPVAGLTPLQALRVVGEHTPPPLSRMDASLRGDLEIIFDKTLAKDAKQRYASAGAFADELRRFLAREPIQARRPGTLHRIALFARRNPAIFGLSLAVFAALAAGLAVSLRFAYGEAAERARAQAAAQQATSALKQSEATLSALNQVFSAGNPIVAGQPEVAFRTVLANADQQLAAVPDVTRAQVLYALARAQASLGDYSAAIERYAHVQELALSGRDDRLRLRAMFQRACLLHEHVSALQSLQLANALWSDPSAAADPALRGGIALLQADLAFGEKHQVSGMRWLQQAVELAKTLPVGEDELRDEFELMLGIRRADLAFSERDGRGAIATLVPELRALIARVQPRLGAEHPVLVRLRLDTDALADAYAPATLGHRDITRRIVEEIDARMPELGPTHPAILARLDAGYDVQNLSDDAVAQYDLVHRLEKVAHALPLSSRWRANNTLPVVNTPPLAKLGLFDSAELLAMAEAQCPQNPAARAFQCWQLRGSAALLMNMEGHPEQSVAAFEQLMDELPANTDLSLLGQAQRSLALAYRWAHRDADAARVTDLALATLARDPEVLDMRRPMEIWNIAWSYRPKHCDRALAVVRPLLPQLERQRGIPRDSLVRMLSTCEVRAGEDPDKAIARLDEMRKTLPDDPSTLVPRGELALAYAEIYDVLGREAELARWGGEWEKLFAQGLVREAYASDRFPGVQHALAAYHRQRGDASVASKSSTAPTVRHP